MDNKALSEKRKLSDLIPWDKNPRDIKPEDLERLVKHLKEFGQYKPLLITSDGVILGGNMRYEAFKKLGVEEVWVSVVDAPDEATRLKYALSDNDRAGYYKDEELANLVKEAKMVDLNFDTDMFRVDVGFQITLSDLVTNFASVDPSTLGIAPQESLADRPLDESTNDKSLESYLSGNIRQIVMFMDVNEHMKTVEDFRLIREHFKVENNTLALFELLKFWKEKNPDEQA